MTAATPTPRSILMVTLGSGGDVLPLISIGRELATRGHRVRLLTNPHFEPRVREAGLEPLALGDEAEYLEAIRDPTLISTLRGPGFVINRLVEVEARRMMAAVKQAIRVSRPDVIVHHFIAFAARWAAEARGIPSVGLTLSPAVLMSPGDRIAFAGLPMERLPQWMHDNGIKWSRRVLRWWLDPRINRVRRELDLPPLRDAFLGEARGEPTLRNAQRTPIPQRTLALWSGHFRTPMPTDPASLAPVGFCWNPPAELPADVREYLESCGNDRPVIVTLGTSVVHHGRSFYQEAARAIHRAGRRGLMLVGPHAPALELPTGVRAFPYAPLRELGPLGAMTIHHGGIGTTAHALRAGRPSLIVPFVNDEFDNAARSVRLGAARSMRPGAFRAPHVAEVIRSMLTDADLARASAELGAKLAAEEGARAAADAILG